MEDIHGVRGCCGSSSLRRSRSGGGLVVFWMRLPFVCLVVCVRVCVYVWSQGSIKLIWRCMSCRKISVLEKGSDYPAVNFLYIPSPSTESGTATRRNENGLIPPGRSGLTYNLIQAALGFPNELTSEHGHGMRSAEPTKDILIQTTYYLRDMIFLQ